MNWEKISFRGIIIAIFCTCFFNNARSQTDTTFITEDTATISVSDAEKHFVSRDQGDTVLSLMIRKVPAATIDSLKKSDEFWYADAVFEKPKQNESSGTDLGWLNTLIWIIIIAGFVLSLGWYLAKSRIVIFGKKRKQIAGETGKEELHENIFEIPYAAEIEKATREGDFRLAIRLMFLRLLKDLSQKKIIRYTNEKTNFDYLSELYQTSHYNEFFRLTRDYEYTWYGRFSVSHEAFTIIQHDFENFSKRF
jgi:hypothetical protein